MANGFFAPTKLTKIPVALETVVWFPPPHKSEILRNFVFSAKKKLRTMQTFHSNNQLPWCRKSTSMHFLQKECRTGESFAILQGGRETVLPHPRGRILTYSIFIFRDEIKKKKLHP